MKTLRSVLIVFMVFFCLISAKLLWHDIDGVVRGIGDSAADSTSVVGRVVGRGLACLLFAWLAIAMWKKNQPPAKSS